MKLKNLYLVGGGGHCVSTIDVIESTKKYNIKGIFDVQSKVGQKILGYPIIDTDSNINKYINEENYFIVTVGQIKNPLPRKKLFDFLLNQSANIPTIISPNAYISKHAEIGQGTVVFHNAVINAEAKIGCNNIINTKALIEHNVIVEDHCHISTAAIINGHCIVSEGSFIGSNSVLEQEFKTNHSAILSAGTFHKTKRPITET